MVQSEFTRKKTVKYILNFRQCRALVGGDVVGFIAFDFVLGIILVGVMGVALIVKVGYMHFHYFPGHVSRLGVPLYMVTHFECLFHYADLS